MKGIGIQEQEKISMKYNLVLDEKYGYKRANPLPTKEEVEKFYMDEFYSSQYVSFNDSNLDNQIKELAFNKMNWDRVVYFLEQDMGSLASKKYFDIGFGYGFVLDYFQDKGCKVSGIEPSKDGYEYASQKHPHVVQGGIEDIKTDIGRFDIVSMFNVLEHLRDPEAAIIQIRDTLLVDKGYLVIDVPNEFNLLQTIGNEMYDLNEWWICPPNHINYFDLASLTHMLSDLDFEICHYYASFPLEMFLLMGDKYVGNGILGKTVHEKRVLFEENLIKHRGIQSLLELYKGFAELGIGRQITLIAKKK